MLVDAGRGCAYKSLGELGKELGGLVGGVDGVDRKLESLVLGHHEGDARAGVSGNLLIKTRMDGFSQ